MAAPTHPTLLFRKPYKTPTYSKDRYPYDAKPGERTAAHVAARMHQPYDTSVRMHEQWWFFPNSTVKGVPNRYVPGQCVELDGVDQERGVGVMVRGYRCEDCKRVFFAADMEDFYHECMEG